MIDIGTKSNSPIGKKLSNFTNWGFVFDGVVCMSIESVLQAFKFPDQEEQLKMCSRNSYWARKFGYNGNKWKDNQILYWQGIEYPRDSSEYHGLLLRLYRECFSQNPEARGLLLSSGEEKLTHSIGKSDPSDTVLTDKELIAVLMILRVEFRKNTDEDLE
jgi:hypothetical protein